MWEHLFNRAIPSLYQYLTSSLSDDATLHYVSALQGFLDFTLNLYSLFVIIVYTSKKTFIIKKSDGEQGNTGIFLDA